MNSRSRSTALAVVAGFSAAWPLGAQESETEGRYPPRMLDPAAETRLALSAGPPSITSEASVWLMTTGGFTLAREGANGFNCFVERIPSDPDVRAPQCLDAIGSEYVLPVKLERAKLHASGRSGAEIEEAISAGFVDGRFRPPPEAAFTYMLSGGQYLGAQAGQWKPHIMVYTPYRTNAQVGGDPGHPEFPFVAFDEGRPLSLTVIVTTQFVDPASVEVGR